MQRFLGRVLCASILLCVSFAAGADAVTDRARALLQRQDAQAAYKLLQPLEPQRAGDPEYDYLLGIAALDAGDPERAVFALERVLALQPDNLQARAEIARAYLAMGEREAAKREFEAVRARQVPSEVRATIERFLSAIAAAERTQLERYLELAFGYDTNVNSATGMSSIAIPFFGGASFSLAPSLTEQDDRFLNFAAGVNFTRKLDLSWSLVGGFSGVMRQNLSAASFSTDTLDASLGVRFARGLDAITVGAQGQYFAVDTHTYRSTSGLVAQWQRSFDERTQATVFAQHAALRYETQPVRDADRSILGVAYAQAFSGEYAPALFASLYGGEEKEVNELFPHLGHKPVGARLGAQWRLGGGWSLFASASYERRKYGGTEPLFLIAREDKQTDLNLGLSYLWRSGTTLRLQLAHTDNSSNVVLNDFDRSVASLSARFNF
ncbi:MAG: tetratricopeptide repeat protein [Betaproteobacteria bacterium]|nr:tetratricopeptide repeat protein [Betaproteobacteria bacterium]